MFRPVPVKLARGMFALLLSVAGALAVAQTSSEAASPESHSSSAPGVGVEKAGLAPDFALRSVNGETVHLSDFRGKAILLNFWATWCAPCKILTPWLVELQNQYGPQGLQTIAIALDEDATTVEIGESADQMHVNYPVLIGNEKVAAAYGGIPAMPVCFFVGRDGKIVDRIIGLKGRSEIEDSIKKALEIQTGANNHPGAPAIPQAQK